MLSLKQRKKIKKRYKVFSGTFIVFFLVLSFTPRTIFAQYGSNTYGKCFYGMKCATNNGGGGSTGGGSSSSTGNSSQINSNSQSISQAPSNNISPNQSSIPNTNIKPSVSTITSNNSQPISVSHRIYLALYIASLITGIAWITFLVYEHNKKHFHHHNLRHA